MVLQHSHRELPIMHTAMDTDTDMHTGLDTAPPCSGLEDLVDTTVTEIPNDQEIDFVTLGMFIIGMSVGACGVCVMMFLV